MPAPEARVQPQRAAEAAPPRRAAGRRASQPGRGTDRRAVRTRAALRDALAAEIMATGDLSQVTVTAVTDRAGVTRRTFYSHYRDIPALVASIEDDALADLREHVAAIAAVNLAELEAAIAACEPCPGSEDALRYFVERGQHLPALLGDGGDPAFAEKIKDMVRDVVYERASSGFGPGGAGAVLDYYLTFAISAEVGVLVRWLTTGMREPVGLMARAMTGLMFVRPGDLYGRPVDFDLPRFALTLMRMAQGRPEEAPLGAAPPGPPGADAAAPPAQGTARS